MSKHLRPEESVDFQIRWTWHKIFRMYNTIAQHYGGSISIGYALLAIDTIDGVPSTKLGPLMGMEPRSLTRTLKAIESKGLIRRIPDKTDKRKVKVVLTPRGLEKRELARNAVLRFNAVVREEIPERKLSGFLDVINKLNDLIDNNDIFAK